jgi:hypothetical protein
LRESYRQLIANMEAAGFYHVLDDKLDRDVLRERISGDF